jgi:Flp pilus assembly pilin Flp
MRFLKSKKGQGIVEYAGALVVAALIVGAVVTAGPSNLASMFNAVIASVEKNITGLL